MHAADTGRGAIGRGEPATSSAAGSVNPRSVPEAGVLPKAPMQRRSRLRRRTRRVQGDLDGIVMKCREKDRSRRYETVHGLARDIERHLEHEPVVARPPNAPRACSPSKPGNSNMRPGFGRTPQKSVPCCRLGKPGIPPAPVPWSSANTPKPTKRIFAASNGVVATACSLRVRWRRSPCTRGHGRFGRVPGRLMASTWPWAVCSATSSSGTGGRIGWWPAFRRGLRPGNFAPTPSRRTALPSRLPPATLGQPLTSAKPPGNPPAQGPPFPCLAGRLLAGWSPPGHRRGRRQSPPLGCARGRGKWLRTQPVKRFGDRGYTGTRDRRDPRPGPS